MKIVHVCAFEQLMVFGKPFFGKPLNKCHKWNGI